MSDNNLEAVSKDILRKLYSEAEPGLDFDKVLENPDDYPEFYDNHYLPEERQREIRTNTMDEHDVPEHRRSGIIWTTCLNYGPRGHTPPEEVDDAS
jgi:hypothetical protein